MNLARLFFIATWSAGGCVCAQAPVPAAVLPLPDSGRADPEPAALRALRAHYTEGIAAADRAAHAQWVQSLAAMEQKRVASGDYAGAERVRSRRESAIAVSGTGDGRLSVKLSARDITSKGSGLTVGDKTITLSSRGAFLEWDRPGDYQGWYEVRLTHAVGGSEDYSAEISPVSGPLPADRRSQRATSDNPLPSAGGWISLQNVSTLARRDVVLRREMVSTGGWNAWKTVSLGKMEITGRARFRLAVDEAYSSGALHFREIELVPAPAPTGGASDGEVKLAKARETFDKTFKLQTSSATARYRESLNLLEQEAMRGKDTDMVVRIKNEKALLTQSPGQLALGGDYAGSGSGKPIKLEVTNSFGCQFRGEIRLDSKTSRLTGLRPQGSASITWRLPVFNVGSGVYSVTLKGRVPVSGGGSATLSAFAAASAPAGKPLKFQIKPVVTPEARNKKPDPDSSPPEPKGMDFEAGSIMIEKGAESLVLTVDGLVHQDGSLAELSSLSLTRTGDVPAKSEKP